MKKFVRSVAAVLVLVLVLGLVPMAFAEDLPQVTTEVTGIQKYGNLDLKIKGSELQELGFKYGDIVTVGINGKTLEMPVVSNYSDVDQGSMLCRIVNDDDTKDYVVLAINMGNLAENAEIADKVKIPEDPGFKWVYREGVKLPVVVTITLTNPGGYYDQWLLHQLKRTNERDDYPQLSDAEFANFRQVTTTGMAPGVLYRSSSPVNPELNRNGYADAAMCKAGVKAVMNLADSKEEMEAYEGFADTYYSQQNIAALNLGVDFASAEFKQGLADGFTFFANEEGPYLVHCTEGKDRAGFTSAILEALMGASAEEIVADYMTTYFNYYGVEEGEQYDVIANSNIKKSLAAAFGIPDITAEGVDLAAEAYAYLKEDLGMEEETIALLKQKLGGHHAPNTRFEDVREDDWFYSYVIDADQGDLMHGTSSTTFSPYANLTRGQMAVILYRMSGEPDMENPSTFPDVAPDAYYADAVAWAQEGGYIQGLGSGEFAPSRPATRQELVTVLYRFDHWATPSDDLTGFADADQVSEFAVPAMGWAVERGFLSGATHDGTSSLWLDPQEPVTRAQAAKICSLFQVRPIG